MKLVLIESPYAADTKEGIEKNETYCRLAMKDCLERGESPYASHILYTQPGVLDDTIPEQRKLGIEAGLCWGRMAEVTVVYTDNGISEGMTFGIMRAADEGRKIEYRKLF